MNRSKGIIGVILCATLLIASTGCISSKKKSSGPTITISRSGVITIADKRVALSKLPTQLSNMGIKKSASISIEIPPNTSTTTLKTVTSTLASSGYRRIVFKKPLVSTSRLTK